MKKCINAIKQWQTNKATVSLINVRKHKLFILKVQIRNNKIHNHLFGSSCISKIEGCLESCYFNSLCGTCWTATIPSIQALNPVIIAIIKSAPLLPPLRLIFFLIIFLSNICQFRTHIIDAFFQSWSYHLGLTITVVCFMIFTYHEKYRSHKC